MDFDTVVIPVTLQGFYMSTTSSSQSMADAAFGSSRGSSGFFPDSNPSMVKRLNSPPPYSLQSDCL